MAKRYHFKLDGVIKLKRIEEYEEKVRLGKITQEINYINHQIEVLIENMNCGYFDQSQNLRTETPGYMTRFYPMYTEGIRAHINSLKKIIAEKEISRNSILNSYAKIKNELKVFEEMKQLDFDRYRKKIAKKGENDLLELLIMRNKGKRNV